MNASVPLNDDMPLDKAVPSTSRYLSKEDVDPPILAQIAYLSHEDVEGDRGVEQKAVLYFNGDMKPLILNIANRELLKAVTGAQTAGQVKNKQIVLYNDQSIMYGKKLTGGIRIRSAEQPLAVPAQQPYATPTAPPPNAGPGSQDFDDSIPY